MQKQTILIVDDTPDNLSLLNDLLRDQYRIKIANGGRRALEIVESNPEEIELILLDIMMPEVSGYDVCQTLKSDPKFRDIPIIFLTAKTGVMDEQKGFEMGAVDYITKPISPPIVLARVKTHLTVQAAHNFLKDKASFLEEEVKRRTKEVIMTQDATILMMASLAETRDNETGNHIRRTQHYIKIIAEEMKKLEKHRDYLTPSVIENIFKSAPLHDIGKIGIPDSILLKPGKYTEEEYEIMKEHPRIGRDAIIAVEKELGIQIEFLSIAKEIAYSHHEKWDGTGYPEKLSGEDIPLSGRMMALADVYDALISKRVYKGSMTHDEARKIILDGRGSHFDPEVVDAFLSKEEDFKRIASTYKDVSHLGQRGNRVTT